MPRRLTPTAAAYTITAALSTTGGARPTGLGSIDALLLAVTGIGVASCARRSRTLPVYVSAGAATITITSIWPLVLGALAVVAAASLQVRQVQRVADRRAAAAALAGGLAWAAVVGSPFHAASSWWPGPVLAMGWMVTSARINGGSSFQRRWNRVAGTTAGLVVAGSLLGCLALLSARADITQGTRRLEAGLDAAQAGDVARAQRALTAAATSIGHGEDALEALWARPALLVPGVSQHLNTLHRSTNAVEDLARVTAESAAAVSLDGLAVTSGRVDIDAILAAKGPVDAVVQALERTSESIAGSSDTWLLPPVRHRLSDVSRRIDEALGSARLVRDGLNVVPGIVGADRPKTYLVLFTTPVESRARSGFPGNFAEIRLSEGHMEMTRFGRIGELTNGLPDGGGTISGPADFLDRYRRFGVERDWRNVTMSPDFPTVARAVGELYPQSGGGQLDGVMTVDPMALAGLLRLTGPVRIPDAGVRLNADNAQEFLLEDQYLEFAGERSDRVDALEAVSEQVFRRLTELEVPGPWDAHRALSPAVSSGGLQLVAFQPEAAAFLDRVGISGRFDAGEGDFVAATTTNAAGNKLDLFLERDLAYDVDWDPGSGDVRATVRLSLVNSAPPSGLPPDLTGARNRRTWAEPDLPVGSNHLFVTVYSPWQSTAAHVDGERWDFEHKRELGLNAYAGYVAIPPGSTRTLTLQLAGSLERPTYELRVVTQPLVVAEDFTLSLAARDARLTVSGPLTPEPPHRIDGDTYVGTAPLIRQIEISAIPDG